MVEYTPVNTNYTQYLKYFLFFIIIVLVIIALLFAGWLLFKNAGTIRDKVKAMIPEKKEAPPPQVDEDDIGGQGYGDNQGDN